MNLRKILELPASNNTYFIQKYIMDFLGSHHIDTQMDDLGNIYVIKGKARFYPCLTAHMDTVHSFKEPEIIETIKDSSKVYTSLEGIGGDDKVGVFICLYLLKKLDNLKVVFFVGEESGGVGSNGVDEKFFNDVGYVLQVDRHGNSDYVNDYMWEPSTTKEFDDRIAKILDKYGYKESSGMFTDVFNLKENEAISVCGCNFSCGYYLPHTNNEYVVERDVYNTISLLKDIIKALGYKLYEHEFKYSGYGYYNKRNHGNEYDNYDDALTAAEKKYEEKEYGSYNTASDVIGTCEECGLYGIPIIVYHDKDYCNDCIKLFDVSMYERENK